MKRLARIIALVVLMLTILSACVTKPATPTIPPASTPVLVTTLASLPPVTKLSISPGKEIEGNFISLFPGSDADTEVMDACQTSGLRTTGNGQSLPTDPSNTVKDFYMQFNVDNEVIFDGQPTSRIQLDIEYCDQGTDSFMVEYDGLNGGLYGDGKFMASQLVIKTDSGRIKTVSFTFNDANFSDRDNGADFRISDMGDGSEAILSVTVTLLPAAPPVVAPATASSTGETADIIFHNGAIITIEESQPVAEAIAIRGELILSVGTNEEILVLQGPDTTVIDLQGRAVLPGFIDGHTHLLAFPDRKGKTMDQAQDIALRYGLTTVNEMWANEAFLDRLFQAEQQGDLRLRVNVFASYNDGILDGNREKVFLKAWYPGHDPILDPQRRVRIPGIKIFIDGDNFVPARGCWAFDDPLPADAWSIKNGVCGTATGDLYWRQDELNAVILEAQNAGYRVAFHAMGEAAIETTLNAIESALDGQPNEQVRHQIEHNSMIRPDLLTRYEELDVLASVRGYGDFCDLKQMNPDFGPERINWYANRYALPGLEIHSYIESDFGWTVDPEARYDQRSLDPVMQLYGIVTHNLEGSSGTMCEPDPVVANFVISVEKALQMMTIEPAYAVSMEDYIGSLKPGKYADLIILSDSPLAVDPDALKNLRVWMTMVGGKVEYCATGKEAFCQ